MSARYLFVLLGVLALTMLVAPAAAIAAPILISDPNDPALDGATLIDFNDKATTNFVTDTIGDVTFTSLANGTLRYAVFNEGGDFGTDGQNLSTRDLSGNFQIEFANAVSAFGMDWGAANAEWTVELFDAGNNSLGSLTFDAGPPFEIYVGAQEGGIARAVFSDPTARDWVLIDNFKYVASDQVVPEPGSIALLALGLGGVVALRRRKSKA